jgi:hypothetical protein
VAEALWRLPLEVSFAKVQLPLSVNWSDPGRTFDLAQRNLRNRCYEIVLREGTPVDIARYVDGALLIDAWDELVLPRDLRREWSRVITTVSE